mgnify:CR=1 FL=1
MTPPPLMTGAPPHLNGEEDSDEPAVARRTREVELHHEVVEVVVAAAFRVLPAMDVEAVVPEVADAVIGAVQAKEFPVSLQFQNFRD